MIPGSSVVEQAAVNRLVAGSSPARGATIPRRAYAYRPSANADRTGAWLLPQFGRTVRFIEKLVCLVSPDGVEPSAL